MVRRGGPRTMWKQMVWVCAFSGSLVLGSQGASADIPRTIAYQGKLTELNGVPLTGEHVLTLRLFDAATGGTALWKEQHTVTLAKTDNGVFSLVFGSQTPFGSVITFTDPLWLSIEVDGKEEFSPRQSLAAVGYAINADTLDGLDGSQLLPVSALGQASPQDVGGSAAAGTSTSVSREDHVHQGVRSLSAVGEAQLAGDVTLSAGSNVTLTQTENDIQIAAAASTPSSGNRATAFASSAIEIGDNSDTTLLSVNVTKSESSSVILVLATVQLNNTGNRRVETDLRLFRGSTQLDGDYTIIHGREDNPAGEVPITLHVIDDTTSTGSLTYTLRARADDDDMEATVRRLTVIELL